ncbi:hypothetical protein GUITHDRAFT_117379 [Guillardia theta CCMP2712]|uniref:Uncharacterized protein n=1 Tax=Guillardia theta (strain CCMP2712) TaxID=905079 RepID=L1IK45_GUITC|nr:hypothetical protein GUITHDRAFT_117379 [Guillardia theta CCMP2712]EKX36487.1 hypothetical protein GUITHDRAFT_117379 [Guillardia theta CCMP2712]|eukprot:XP_005823467.1 hypothetical protein GUITHDRAFT_117379 [Guillardia theta CCMP2712]
MGNSHACMFCDQVTKTQNPECHYEVSTGHRNNCVTRDVFKSKEYLTVDKENKENNCTDANNATEIAEMKQRAKLAREAAVALLGKLPNRKNDFSDVQERHAKKVQGMYLHNKLMEALEEARKEAETKIIENMQSEFNVQQIKAEMPI